MDFHNGLPLIWYSDQTSVRRLNLHRKQKPLQYRLRSRRIFCNVLCVSAAVVVLEQKLVFALVFVSVLPFRRDRYVKKMSFVCGLSNQSLQQEHHHKHRLLKKRARTKKSSIWAENPKQIFQSVFIRITEGFKSKPLQNVICEAHKQSGCTQVPSGKRKSKIPYKRFVGMARPRLLLRVSSESVWSRASSRIAQKSPVRNDICNNVSF